MRKLKTEVIEKLVSFVREYPLLYDRTDGYYKDSQMAYSTWDVIAQDMECPSMTGRDWKKKWRNIRDIYIKKRRQVRMNKGNINGLRARKWTYFDSMSFLDVFTEDNKYFDENCTDLYVPAFSDDQSGAGSDDDLDLSSRSASPSAVGLPAPEVTVKLEPPYSPSSQEPTTIATMATMATESTKKAKKRKWTVLSKESQEQPTPLDSSAVLADLISETTKEPKFFQDIEAAQTPPPRSAEELFFQSAAMRMSKLPEQTKSYLMYQMSTLLFNAENPQIPPVPITPLPTTPQ